MRSSSFDFSLFPKVLSDSTNSACIIIALAATIVLVCTFLKAKNKGKFTGFLGVVYEFFNFKCFVLDDILKFLYLLSACYCTLIGLVSLFSDALTGLFILIVSNVVLRISYELLLLLFNIAKNISEINKKLDKKNKTNNTVAQKPVDDMQYTIPMEPVSINNNPEASSNQTEDKLELSKPEINSDNSISFCPNCGTKIEADYNNCPNCGTNLR